MPRKTPTWPFFKNQIIRGPVAYKLDDETRREVDRVFDILSEGMNVIVHI